MPKGAHKRAEKLAKRERFFSMFSCLGTKSDKTIADSLGVGTNFVRDWRVELGIRPQRRNWDSLPLGRVPDGVLAKQEGIDYGVVREARRLRGIAAYEKFRICPCGQKFKVFRQDGRFCSFRCQRYHWQLVNCKGMKPEVADCAIAVWAMKRTLKGLRPCGVPQASFSRRSTKPTPVSRITRPKPIRRTRKRVSSR